ncbi:MAG: replicative DNA helicase [Thermacetogeniaceae bacterium]
MELQDRLSPHNQAAEQAVLGALLLAPDSIAEANEILKPEDFYTEGHRELYRVLYGLAEAGSPIDLVTVTEALQKQGLLDKVGSASYLASLAGSVPTAVNIGYYARIVAEKGLLRNIISTCSQLAAKGYDEGVEVERLLDEAERMVLELSTRRQSRSYRSLRELLHEALERVEKLYKNRGSGVTGLATGFTDLDDLTCGLQPSDLILLAARPSMGKTSLGLNIARNVAMNRTMPVPVLVFSLEMSNDQVAQRLLCSEARVSQNNLRKGFVRDDEWPRLAKAAADLAEAPIYVDDTPSISPFEMRSKARRLRAERNVGLIVVDYLQLMQMGKRVENRVQEISEISRFLKSLARELDIPVLALSQLSRAVEQRSDRKPQLSDLRESGSLEQDADLVMFIYFEDPHNKQVAEIIVAKHRNGPIDNKRLAFLESYTKFLNFEESEPPDFTTDPDDPGPLPPDETASRKTGSGRFQQADLQL